MNRKLSFAATSGAFVLLCAQSADAAEWHYAHDARPKQGSAREVAEAHLRDAIHELGLAGVDLQFKSELSVGAHRTVRFTQWYAGLPVLGASAAVRTAADGSVEVTVLEIARGLAVSPTPALSAQDAVRAVESRVGPLPSAKAALGVLPERAGIVVWSVDVPSSRGGYRYLIDAHSGRAVGQRPLGMDVKGRVYAVSSVVTPTPTDVDLLELVTASPQKLVGWGGQLAVTNYVSGGAMGGGLVLAQDLVPNVGEDFLYDPPADKNDSTDGFAQVGVYHHLTRMKNYFSGSFGLDMSPASWKLTAAANVLDDGVPMDNAYFSPEGVGAPWSTPNLIAIGQGSLFDFADDSDVFLHEFGHYVSFNAVGYNEGQLATSEYGFSPFGGSIDEGIADYFACSENGDPILGEASLGPLDAARDLTKIDKVCPEHVIGEVHADGEIIGSVGWSLRTAFGQAAGDQLVWGAVSLLTKGASLGDFGKGVLQTTNDLVADGVLTAADVPKVAEILAARGLDDCDHELDIDTDHPTRKTTLIGLDLLGKAFGADCSTLQLGGFSLQSLFHFRATPAEGDEGIRFVVDLGDPSSDGALSWNLYVRRIEHVGFSPGGGFLPEISEYDYAVEGITTEHGEIVIDADSDPPFDPAVSYHLVIGQSNCPDTVASLSVEAATATGEGGAGGDAASAAGVGGSGAQAPAPKSALRPDDSGCGCRIAGADEPERGALLAFGIAALFAARRRRTRPT